jgi:outer membrane lipoprotein SlyB
MSIESSSDDFETLSDCSHDNIGETTTGAIAPNRKKLKLQRKRRTASGALGGCILGGIALGPVGAVVGVGVGAVVTKNVCKAREKRAQRRWELNQVVREKDTQSLVHQGFYV